LPARPRTSFVFTRLFGSGFAGLGQTHATSPCAGLRSLAKPVVDTTSDFAELILAMLGVAAKLERRHIAERTARGRADAKAKGSEIRS
jgi:hypothetical protein